MAENAQLESEFCSNVASLYDSIQSWLPGGQLDCHREEVQLAEEAIGAYTSEKLVLADKKRHVIATFLPVGASVIGADGRVDVRGKYDNVSLLLLRKEGPSLTRAGGGLSSHSKFYFNTIDADGWYWIEDTLRGRAHLLDETLFRDLLWRVSDYELA